MQVYVTHSSYQKLIAISGVGGLLTWDQRLGGWQCLHSDRRDAQSRRSSTVYLGGAEEFAGGNWLRSSLISVMSFRPRDAVVLWQNLN